MKSSTFSAAPFRSSRIPTTGNDSIDRTVSGASSAIVSVEFVMDGPPISTTAATAAITEPSMSVVPATRGSRHRRRIAEIGRSSPAAMNPATANQTTIA
jgi:hypothetical protein